MSSPAERYAASRRRTRERRDLGSFEQHYDFPSTLPDRRACRALSAGRGSWVAAPTGAGKTMWASSPSTWRSRPAAGVYTTPIRPQNQKYHDLVERYGAERVGLLTGDNSINADAPIVVMTTEVLRNMIYAQSRRCPTWPMRHGRGPLPGRPIARCGVEEVLIHLPDSVTITVVRHREQR